MMPFWKFLSPRHWLVWIGLGIMRLGICLPYTWQLKLGTRFGSIAYRLLKKRRYISATNIRLCFPELSPNEQEVLNRRFFESASMAIFETALCWWASKKRLIKLAHFEGFEHIQCALEKGKGVILLSAHITCSDIGGRLLSYCQTYRFVYKKAKNPLFETFMVRGRERYDLKAIYTYQLRDMIIGLKNNEVIFYAMDQDFGAKHSIFAPFMGVMATTLTTPTRLAKMTGATVVPYFPRRLNNGKGYKITILPPLKDFPSDDEVKDATRINQIIERAIRKAPEQYFWAHRRFKTRPPGEKNVY